MAGWPERHAEETSNEQTAHRSASDNRIGLRANGVVDDDDVKRETVIARAPRAQQQQQRGRDANEHLDAVDAPLNRAVGVVIVQGVAEGDRAREKRRVG